MEVAITETIHKTVELSDRESIRVAIDVIRDACDLRHRYNDYGTYITKDGNLCYRDAFDEEVTMRKARESDIAAIGVIEKVKLFL